METELLQSFSGRPELVWIRCCCLRTLEAGPEQRRVILGLLAVRSVRVAPVSTAVLIFIQKLKFKAVSFFLFSYMSNIIFEAINLNPT